MASALAFASACFFNASAITACSASLTTRTSHIFIIVSSCIAGTRLGFSPVCLRVLPYLVTPLDANPLTP